MTRRVFAISVFILSVALSISFFFLQDYLKEAAALGLLGIFLINLISNASFFISAPAFLTVIAGGAMYPPLIVAFISSLGAAFGDGLSFIIGFSGRHAINHKLKKKIWFKVLEDYFKMHGGWIIFIFAFLPNPFFDSIGIIAGVFAYSPLRFFLIAFIGRFIRYFFLASFGSSL